MKKIVLAVVLAGCSYGAMAAVACAVGTATGVATSTTNFIKNAITPRCSANTYVNYTDGTTKVDVGSASLKGKNYFGGSSEGGAVTARGQCAAACSATDAASGATAAGSS
jgi:hypothetical protein